MTIYDQLTSPKAWDEYLAYKRDRHHLTRAEEKDLTSYIENKEYLAACETLFDTEETVVPTKKLIRKMDTAKKRVVYMYPREVNYVLKLMTFLLLRKYDGIFADNLYSFRVNTGVNKAMSRILKTRGLSNMYTYKVDISNYFNSIPVDKICIRFAEILQGEKEIFTLLARLLLSPFVLDNDILVEEQKGVMAGTPFAVFLANLYLMEMDKYFEGLTEGKLPGEVAVTAEEKSSRLIYARYSDDIIVMSNDKQKRDEAEEIIKKFLSEKGLGVNEKKEIRTNPGEAWSFLGIGYEGGKVDISTVSKEKIKAKIRRRARAIKRWQARKGVTNIQATKAFIKAMNRKFFDPDSSHELTWARWYFPVITTDETLHELDLYMQYWIRYLATGHHNQKAYEFTYEDRKELGYISLVHEWYKE